jgi:glutamate formiminotransferase/formiminotetrahydrofolate cyclodeaminase
MKKLIECVPNISEGRNPDIIKQVTDVIETVDGVKLLDVDPGNATNRTVITFVGEPQPVIDAAFLVIQKAAEVIDMSKHSGEHPRFGATDVCPLVPISNMTMDETVVYAHKLAKRVGEELAIPVYCYENAAQEDKRKNLANCRSGEYEGLKNKLNDPEWKPDFGPAEFNDRVKGSGVTAISARDFLVAYNINLNSTSTRRANAIAFDIREAGRLKTEGNIVGAKKVLDENGEPVRIPGKLKAVKGIGWYIEEYGIAQISYNLTNISITSVHEAFHETVKAATERGIRVTGSELVGLIPKQAMLDAADFFLKMQERSLGIDEKEKIKIAVKSLGLDDLKPFDPRKSVIEYVMEDQSEKRLIDMDLVEFANETASESPAPGGGSISAYVGALGVSLGGMVANLSAHKRGWDNRWEEYSDWAVKAQILKEKLLFFVDEDTHSFNKVMDAFRLPKDSDAEKEARSEAISKATKYAIDTPLAVMQTAYDSMEIMKEMSKIGLEASISDAGVGAMCALTAIRGAGLNVKINCSGFKDIVFVEDRLNQAAVLIEKATRLEKEIVTTAESKL